MDIKDQHILIYGRSDIVLHDLSNTVTISVKQDSIAAE